MVKGPYMLGSVFYILKDRVSYSIKVENRYSSSSTFHRIDKSPFVIKIPVEMPSKP